MKRLGVVGTMVWDTIYGRGTGCYPVEEWGGIGYALAALEATLPRDWQIVPLIKVGRDLAAQANEFLMNLTRRSGAARFVEVPEPNNRVTLRYQELVRSAEKMSGGVPPWNWEQLGPMVQDVDALYVNFISGFEMGLDTALRLRQGFTGPIYADLHSLFLGVRKDGLRVPELPSEVATWFSCFDVVQLNESEMGLLGEDALEIAARVLASGVRLLIVTLGPLGAVYFSVPSFTFAHVDHTDRGVMGPIHTARIPVGEVADALDPTGCGDVFGATVVSFLAQGLDVVGAIHRGNENAARNLTHRGATDLHRRLRGEMVGR